MPIEHFPGGTVYTGEAITYYQLCVQRSAVELEMRGLQIRRGRKVWPRLADHYGIRPRTAKAVFAWLDAKVKSMPSKHSRMRSRARRRITASGTGRRQRMNRFQDLLYVKGACPPARDWVGNRTLAEAWAACSNADWMHWLIDAMGIPTPECNCQPGRSFDECAAFVYSNLTPDELREQYTSAVYAAYEAWLTLVVEERR